MDFFGKLFSKGKVHGEQPGLSLLQDADPNRFVVLTTGLTLCA